MIFTACVACKNQFRNWFLLAKNPFRRIWFLQLDFSKIKYRSTGGVSGCIWWHSRNLYTVLMDGSSAKSLFSLGSITWREVGLFPFWCWRIHSRQWREVSCTWCSPTVGPVGWPIGTHIIHLGRMGVRGMMRMDVTRVWQCRRRPEIRGDLNPWDRTPDQTNKLSLKNVQFRSKSLYRSHTGRHFYGTENVIWAGFGPIGNTEKKSLGQLWATFEDGFLCIFKRI